MVQRDRNPVRGPEFLRQITAPRHWDRLQPRVRPLLFDSENPVPGTRHLASPKLRRDFPPHRTRNNLRVPHLGNHRPTGRKRTHHAGAQDAFQRPASPKSSKGGYCEGGTTRNTIGNRMRRSRGFSSSTYFGPLMRCHGAHTSRSHRRSPDGNRVSRPLIDSVCASVSYIRQRIVFSTWPTRAKPYTHSYYAARRITKEPITGQMTNAQKGRPTGGTAGLGVLGQSDLGYGRTGCDRYADRTTPMVLSSYRTVNNPLSP